MVGKKIKPINVWKTGPKLAYDDSNKEYEMHASSISKDTLEKKEIHLKENYKVKTKIIKNGKKYELYVYPVITRAGVRGLEPKKDLDAEYSPYRRG